MSFIKNLFIKSDGTFSMTMLGGWLIAISGCIAAVCALPLHTIHIPAIISDIGMIIGTVGAFIGGGTLVAGARNAYDKRI